MRSFGIRHGAMGWEGRLAFFHLAEIQRRGGDAEAQRGLQELRLASF